MKSVKKILALLLAAVMTVSLLAVALRTSCENLAHNLQKRKSV